MSLSFLSGSIPPLALSCSVHRLQQSTDDSLDGPFPTSRPSGQVAREHDEIAALGFHWRIHERSRNVQRPQVQLSQLCYSKHCPKTVKRACRRINATLERTVCTRRKLTNHQSAPSQSDILSQDSRPSSSARQANLQGGTSPSCPPAPPAQ